MKLLDKATPVGRANRNVLSALALGFLLSFALKVGAAFAVLSDDAQDISAAVKLEKVHIQRAEQILIAYHTGQVAENPGLDPLVALVNADISGELELASVDWAGVERMSPFEMELLVKELGATHPGSVLLTADGLAGMSRAVTAFYDAQMRGNG